MPRPRKEYVTLLRYAKPGFGVEYESAKVKFEKEWLSDYVQREFNMTLDDFLNEYTWDVVDPIERKNHINNQITLQNGFKRSTDRKLRNLQR